MMTHREYKDARLTYCVRETLKLGYQCIAQAKDYAKQVHGIQLGTFGGAARLAAYKKGRAFDPDKRHKLTPGPTVRAEQGDIVVINAFPGNPYGHVGVIDRQVDGGYYIIEQNAKTGNGSGYGDDAIMLNFKKRSDYPILNFYRKK